MSLVSIIIPVYRTEAFIETCLQSVYEQTYEQLEIILIDNGNEAALSSELQKLAEADNRIRLFELRENMGAGYARNYGIRQAKGEYVYFLDSDDYLPRETIELLADHIGQSPIISGSKEETYLSNTFTMTFQGLSQPSNYTKERFNLIKDNSALNWLIKRDFIESYGLSFNQETSLYSDLQFMIPALLHVEQVPYLQQAVYLKRRRNDPILNPSLSQSIMSVKISAFLEHYLNYKESYQDMLVQRFLDNQLFSFYRDEINCYFKENDQADADFDLMREAFQKANNKYLTDFEFWIKREIRVLKQGKKSKFIRVNNTHHFLRALRRGATSRSMLYRFIYRYFFTKLPRKKSLIFFESFLGKNYSDSPKYIYEHLLETNEKFQYVWSVNKRFAIPGSAKQVKRFSLKYFYYIARAEYWVSNSRIPKYLHKPKGTTYLQTWHGTPLKKLVFDMDNIYSADPKYKENFYEQSRRWDYLSSPNVYSSEIFKRAFQYQKRLLEFGYPRNDILYQKNNPESITNLKQMMGIPRDKKVILYAPTWRDNDYVARGKYNFQLPLDLGLLRERVGSDYVVLLRMHYFIANQIDLTGYEGFAYNFSNYNDIAELYLVSDVLITDYSSVFFDYANLKRPILFYTFDLESYRDQIRGLYLDIENELPGPLLMSSEEVVSAIEHIDDIESDYEAKYDEFYKRFCSWDDGNASAKTVQTVFLDDKGEDAR